MRLTSLMHTGRAKQSDNNLLSNANPEKGPVYR